MSLRSRKHYSVNLLVGGYDTAEHAPHLYGIQIDYFGTMAEVPSPLAPPATARTLRSVYSTVARAYSLPRDSVRADALHQIPRPRGAARGGTRARQALHRRGLQAPRRQPGKVRGGDRRQGRHVGERLAELLPVDSESNTAQLDVRRLATTLESDRPTSRLRALS
ncbi:hypothetical protein DFH09DRAFT_1109187 [Mycena vulgaris]|nr:hypothetical protein DFH09DRAFT_1109187 [Mycena vulgaris]